MIDEKSQLTPLDKRPLSLVLIATLFILAGVFYVLRALSTMSNRHSLPLIDLTSLALPIIGIGLLLLRQFFRVCALICTGLFGLALIGCTVLVITGHTYIYVDVGSVELQAVNHKLAFSFCILIGGCIASWIFHVLTRRDIRQLFH